MSQFNKLSMYNAVDAVLLGNKTEWEGHTGFAEAVMAFGKKIITIRAEAARQEEALRGVKAEKLQYKKRLAEIAARTANNVRAYATSVDDEKLRSQVRFSFSELSRSRDGLLATRATIIHDEALTHIENLGKFGVSPESLEELLAAIREYESRSSATRVAISLRSAFTTGLNRLFREADKILGERLDLMMFNFHRHAGLFYDTYFGARVIVDHHRHGALLNVALKEGESETVQRVIFDAPLTNTGKTALACSFRGEKEAEVTVTVLPGKVERMRAADGIVTITNEDRNKPGSFTVRITSTRAVNGEEEGSI